MTTSPASAATKATKLLWMSMWSTNEIEPKATKIASGALSG